MLCGAIGALHVLLQYDLWNNLGWFSEYNNFMMYMSLSPYLLLQINKKQYNITVYVDKSIETKLKQIESLSSLLKTDENHWNMTHYAEKYRKA